MKKFLLVDSHTIIRAGLKEILCEIFQQPEVHEAGDSGRAIENLKNYQYDLIVMDIKILNTSTFGLMELIHDKYPEAKVLIFSMHPENIHGKRFIEAGARGFLSKEASLEKIIKMINLILNDEEHRQLSRSNVLEK